MSIDLDIINEQTEITITHEWLELFKRVMNEAAKHQGVESGEVVLSFVDNPSIQQLNRDYRNIDRPTDVLSFAMSEEGEGELAIAGADLPTMLGDIVISAERAREQAEEYGHSLERELCFLLVHGFLHLIGYDHETEEQEKEMFGLQEEILSSMGITR